jgi:hypothetical protein
LVKANYTKAEAIVTLPFHFYDICNQHEFISGCAYGKKCQVLNPSIFGLISLDITGFLML